MLYFIVTIAIITAFSIVFSILYEKQKAKKQNKEDLHPVTRYQLARSRQILWSHKKRIQDPSWKHLKSIILDLRGHVCEECGCTDKPLELHHIIYDNLWYENYKELALLCRTCHQRTHDLYAKLGHDHLYKLPSEYIRETNRLRAWIDITKEKYELKN